MHDQPQALLDRFPIGATVSLEALDADPYPIYAALREHEPVSWAPQLKMWLITRHDLVSSVLMDGETFQVGSEASLIEQIFGEQMLSTEGTLHRRYRPSSLQAAFAPKAIRTRARDIIERHVSNLLDALPTGQAVDLREHFAARLPILTMLSLFGLDEGYEHDLRRFYDAFERALANFSAQADVRQQAERHVADFHILLRDALPTSHDGTDSLILAMGGSARALSDEEIRRTLMIIFFGGISTVEALTLNTLYAILRSYDIHASLKRGELDLPPVIEETIRWLSPVQSATRHVAHATMLEGVALSKGETVQCLLGSANRDPLLFTEPDRFVPGRANISKHLAFARGPHFCLGMHLARLEVELAVQGLMNRFGRIALHPGKPVRIGGHEFRQPSELRVHLQ